MSLTTDELPKEATLGTPETPQVVPKVTSKALPLAYVKLSSGYLASVDVEIAEAEARQIAAEFGIIEDTARVGRTDLFVDFVTGVDLEGSTAANADGSPQIRCGHRGVEILVGETQTAGVQAHRMVA